MNELRITFGLEHFEAMVDETAAQEIIDIAARSIIPRLHENLIGEKINEMISFGVSPEKIFKYLKEEQRTPEVMLLLSKNGLSYEKS